MCPNGNSDLTRELIITSAIQIISQGGLRALTAAKLIEQAGISKGGLYHHFRTLQAVEVEVLEDLMRDFSMALKTYPDPGTREEFLEHLEKMLFEDLLAHPETAKALFAFVSAAGDPKVKILLRRLSDDLILRWQEQLACLTPAASAASLNNTAQVIFTMHMGLMSRFCITEELTSLKLYWRGCKSLLQSLLDKNEDAEPESGADRVRPMLIAANIKK